MEKMTYAKAVTALLNGEEMTTEIREKLEALVVSLNKKANGEKVKAKNAENDTIRDAILAILSKSDKALSITEMVVSAPMLKDYSNQKISSQLSALIKDNAVERVKEKGKTFFRMMQGE